MSKLATELQRNVLIEKDESERGNRAIKTSSGSIVYPHETIGLTDKRTADMLITSRDHGKWFKLVLENKQSIIVMLKSVAYYTEAGSANRNIKMVFTTGGEKRDTIICKNDGYGLPDNKRIWGQFSHLLIEKGKWNGDNLAGYLVKSISKVADPYKTIDHEELADMQIKLSEYVTRLREIEADSYDGKIAAMIGDVASSTSKALQVMNSLLAQIRQ
jgi:hypothetical protein